MLGHAILTPAAEQADPERAVTMLAEAASACFYAGNPAELTFGLAGLAWLLARRGREQECRRCAAEALRLAEDLGIRLHEIWATAALGELEPGLGDAAQAAGHFERLQRLLAGLGITDVDLSPGADLADAYLRLGRHDEARQAAAQFAEAADAKGQPRSLARAFRCRGLLAADGGFAEAFEQAMLQHAKTPDGFEVARTRLAYGERLRRSRNRVLAREQLRAAAEVFERLDAQPWAGRARAELAATGETRRPRDPAL
jgi:tetratricopeptide (TPR) repeat protein